ncbi:hypothetical protein [Nocardia sp. NPDC004123]
MAVARTPRGRWVEEGLRALVAGGPEAVRIEALAQAQRHRWRAWTARAAAPK